MTRNCALLEIFRGVYVGLKTHKNIKCKKRRSQKYLKNIHMSETFHEKIELERPPYFTTLVHTKPIYIFLKNIYIDI